VPAPRHLSRSSRPRQQRNARTRCAAVAAVLTLLLAGTSCSDSGSADDRAGGVTSTSSARSGEDSPSTDAPMAETTLSADDEPDPWVRTYCATLQDLTSADEPDESDPLLLAMIEESLDAADQAATEPESAAIKALRVEVNEPDVDPASLGNRPFAPCFRAMVGSAPRFMIDDGVDDFEPCQAMDLDLMFNFVPGRERPNFMDSVFVSVWSTGSEDAPLDGVVVEIQGPGPDSFDPSGKLQGAVEVTPGDHDNVWQVIVTPEASTTPSEGDALPTPPSFALTVLGTDKEGATKIADGIKVVDGELRPADDSFREVVAPFDASDLSVGAWEFVVRDGEFLTTISPSPVTPSGMSALMGFGEATQSVAPTSEFEDIEVGGKPALFGSDPQSAGIFVEIEGQTLQLMTLDTDASYRDRLIDLAESLRSADADQWAAYIATPQTCELPTEGN